jgi:predicted CXXCH cytochrome family protein
MALQSRVKDTPHNLNNQGIAVPNQEVCRPCHAPHNASTEVGYLWNHELSPGGWTLNSDADPNSVMSSSSRLCLSCHDGSVAIDSYGGASGTRYIGGTENLGSDLTNDHPIGVLYPTTGTRYNLADANGNVADSDPLITPVGQSAHIENGRVQCASCHYAHGTRAAYGMFLRVDNVGSKLCMTCHRGPG